MQQRNSGSKDVQEQRSLDDDDDRYKLDYHLPIVNQHLINFYYQFPSLILEKLVQTHIIENWEANDEPEHLKTIRDRLLRNEQRTGGLLGLYQQILQGVEVCCDDGEEQIELLLSGLVTKQRGKLVRTYALRSPNPLKKGSQCDLGGNPQDRTGVALEFPLFKGG